MNEELIVDLYKIGAVKFGEFTLKSGIISPIYIDLRILISFPKTLKKVATLMEKKLEALNFDLIAGIPYAALPIVSVIAVDTEKPMIYARKEQKKYGTKKLIEGLYKKGQRCVIVDDLITTGDSKIETAIPFQKEGIIVKDFLVLVDREHGGKEFLEEKGYSLHSLIKITDLLNTLEKKGYISKKQKEEVNKFLESTRK